MDSKSHFPLKNAKFGFVDKQRKVRAKVKCVFSAWGLKKLFCFKVLIFELDAMIPQDNDGQQLMNCLTGVGHCLAEFS